ncbi:MAG TPA: hypothetical protein VJS30_11205, partial [Paraburkholderia sp.]|nr:hypothetical protein [Paraburkholderia sp.]
VGKRAAPGAVFRFGRKPLGGSHLPVVETCQPGFAAGTQFFMPFETEGQVRKFLTGFGFTERRASPIRRRHAGHPLVNHKSTLVQKCESWYLWLSVAPVCFSGFGIFQRGRRPSYPQGAAPFFVISVASSEPGLLLRQA